MPNFRNKEFRNFGRRCPLNRLNGGRAQSPVSATSTPEARSLRLHKLAPFIYWSGFVLYFGLQNLLFDRSLNLLFLLQTLQICRF